MQGMRYAILAIIVSALASAAAASVGKPPQEDALRPALRSAKAGTLTDAERAGLIKNPLLP